MSAVSNSLGRGCICVGLSGHRRFPRRVVFRAPTFTACGNNRVSFMTRALGARVHCLVRIGTNGKATSATLGTLRRKGTGGLLCLGNSAGNKATKGMRALPVCLLRRCRFWSGGRCFRPPVEATLFVCVLMCLFCWRHVVL